MADHTHERTPTPGNPVDTTFIASMAQLSLPGNTANPQAQRNGSHLAATGFRPTYPHPTTVMAAAAQVNDSSRDGHGQNSNVNWPLAPRLPATNNLLTRMNSTYNHAYPAYNTPQVSNNPLLANQGLQARHHPAPLALAWPRPHHANNEVALAAFRPETGFQCSAMIDPVMREIRENPTMEEIGRRLAFGVSPNYRGDYTLARNRPAAIPEHENASVFITNLPPTVTVNQLLTAIRNKGRVWACVLNEPEIAGGTAAAKITFFEAAAAQALLHQANGPGQPGFWVGGFPALVRPDRNRVPEATEPRHHTRCISVYGPRELVNEEYLGRCFSERFYFQTDEVIFWARGRVINFVEWRFGSYRCQSQWALRNIREDAFLRARGVTVKFERDPCDIPH